MIVVRPRLLRCTEDARPQGRAHLRRGRSNSPNEGDRVRRSVAAMSQTDPTQGASDEALVTVPANGHGAACGEVLYNRRHRLFQR